MVTLIFCLISLSSCLENTGADYYYSRKTSQFRKSYIAFSRLTCLRLGLIDATGGRNVSVVPNFQATTCFYSQNTATVDFVAEKFRVTVDG
jgi:hypothetical protein